MNTEEQGNWRRDNAAVQLQQSLLLTLSHRFLPLIKTLCMPQLNEMLLINHSYELEYQQVHRTGSAFLLLLPNADVIWNSFMLFPECCKAVIKVYFPSLVKHSFISRSCVVCFSCRVRRWKVCFFWGPAVAPAVLQVLALLRVAGGLRLLPRPWPDSVYRLQQRRLTTTDRTLLTCTRKSKNIKHCWRPAEKPLNLSFAHEHCNITNSLTV